MDYFKKVKKWLKRHQPEETKPETKDFVLAAAHGYFMDWLPHSYFLRKGPRE